MTWKEKKTSIKSVLLKVRADREDMLQKGCLNFAALSSLPSRDRAHVKSQQ